MRRSTALALTAIDLDRRRPERDAGVALSVVAGPAAGGATWLASFTWSLPTRALAGVDRRFDRRRRWNSGRAVRLMSSPYAGFDPRVMLYGWDVSGDATMTAVSAARWRPTRRSSSPGVTGRDARRRVLNNRGQIRCGPLQRSESGLPAQDGAGERRKDGVRILLFAENQLLLPICKRRPIDGQRFALASGIWLSALLQPHGTGFTACNRDLPGRVRNATSDAPRLRPSLPSPATRRNFSSQTSVKNKEDAARKASPASAGRRPRTSPP